MLPMEKERFEERKRLESLTEKIDRDVDSIIVEGFSDKKMMQKLGFTGRIFLSAERKLEDLVEDVSRSTERVAVLTDFDDHGKKRNREIARELEKKIDVIRASRKEFGAQLTSTGRQCIEDIAPLFDDRNKKFRDATLDRLFFRS
jgi:5S rRNA maturation endonuclease (ribonuclease M5)